MLRLLLFVLRSVIPLETFVLSHCTRCDLVDDHEFFIGGMRACEQVPFC